MALGALVAPAHVQKAGSHQYPVLSMTMHGGLVEQTARFKKRIASRDITDYKVVRRGQLVVGFPINEGVLDFQSEHDSAVVSPAYGVWDVRDESLVDRGYLKRFLTSPRALAYYAAKMKGSTARRRSLPPAAFNGMPVPLPPINEQRRLAAILDKADDLRTKRRQILVHLDSLTQALFHDMFGDARPETTVGDLAEIQGGLQVSVRRNALPIEVAYLRVANAHRGRLDLGEVKVMRATEAEIARTRLTEGDLLFVEGHANPMEVGRVAVWEGQLDTCVHQNHLIRGRLDKTRALPVFVSNWLNSAAGSAHFRRAGKTTSGLNTISASVVRSAPMPLRSMDLQLEFELRVDRIQAQGAAVRRALKEGDELLASLQSRAFRGQL